MKKRQIVGLVVAGILFIAVGVTSVFSNSLSEKVAADNVAKMLASGENFNPPMSDYIAIVRVEGVIQQQTEASIFETEAGYQHTDTINYIDKLKSDKNNKGILLYVDSPGGTVYESDELYAKLNEYKEETKRPIWDYMAHYAASGGYLVSMAADKIYANTNTVTGSIGVIMSGYDMSGLYEKLGIRYISITSGQNKDSSKMTDEQIAIYQSQVDEAYQDFTSKVADGREMTQEQVKTLADGRTYTAKQAKSNGLIDEIALYEDMKNEMSKELGTHNFYEPEKKSSLLSSIYSKAKDITPKSEAQILMEAAAEMESGVPMYYAEQLQ